MGVAVGVGLCVGRAGNEDKRDKKRDTGERGRAEKRLPGDAALKQHGECGGPKDFADDEENLRHEQDVAFPSRRQVRQKRACDAFQHATAETDEKVRDDDPRERRAVGDAEKPDEERDRTCAKHDARAKTIGDVSRAQGRNEKAEKRCGDERPQLIGAGVECGAQLFQAYGRKAHPDREKPDRGETDGDCVCAAGGGKGNGRRRRLHGQSKTATLKAGCGKRKKWNGWEDAPLLSRASRWMAVNHPLRHRFCLNG